MPHDGRQYRNIADLTSKVFELLYTDQWENCCGETIVERHYRLTIVEAKQNLLALVNPGQLDRVAERAQRLPGGWVKYIHCEATGNGGSRRRWTSCSPRPYVQGYGCDGRTDECIHLLASTLAQRLGLDYESLYARAYPDQEMEPGWTETLERARGETIVPDDVDPLLALDDLMDINDYDLTHVLGEELVARGLVPENRVWIRSGAEFEARQERALQQAREMGK